LIIDQKRIFVVQEVHLSAPSGGDDRESAGHRFQKRQADAFASRGKHKSMRPRVKVSEGFGMDVPGDDLDGGRTLAKVQSGFVSLDAVANPVFIFIRRISVGFDDQ